MQTEIEKAIDVIRDGGVILYPTDTMWALGCDPKNDAAINRILEIKQSEGNKNLIVLVPNEQLLNRYVKEIPEVCYDLLDNALEPLTIIYPHAQHLSSLITAEDNSVGVRLTKDPFCQKICSKLKSGIVSTSANISGSNAPSEFKEVDNHIIENVDYVVNLPDYRGTTKPSQIIKIKENGEFQIIRK
jgi:L-threonylcarbamoyladenylate synthase